MAEHGHHHGEMDPEKQRLMMEQEIKLVKNMNNIKYKIAVMSGKGGVGKSTVAANLAETFAKKGFKTGILDADIHGPNIPRMLGVDGLQLGLEEQSLVPVETKTGIEVVSMAFLLETNDTPIIWRGPQKSGTIKQLMSDVKWGNLDVLIIDNPPGTGDEPLTVLQSLPDIDAVVMVTTPNAVSQDDVLKCVNMTKMLNIENIGLVENMAYYVCPHCGEEIDMFGERDGDKFAELMDITYLGSLPLTEKVTKAVNSREAIVVNQAKGEISKKFSAIVDKINKKFLNKE